MDIENEEFERLRQLKALQASNCRKVKPWRKATGPRSLAGKKKVTQNLPNQHGKIAKVLRNLEKLDEAVAKLRRREERAKKRQVTALQKLEPLKEAHSQKSNR
jgi:hypothetical protein